MKRPSNEPREIRAAREAAKLARERAIHEQADHLVAEAIRATRQAGR